MNNKRNIFLNEVTGQIRSKEAREYVSCELDYHLQKAKRVWLEKGLTDQESEEKAIEQMGNPRKIGMQMNKIHRPKVDWFIMILFVSMLCLGFFPLFPNDPLKSYFIMHKVIFILVGGMVALGIMLFDYRKLEKRGWIFYSVGMLIFLVLCFFPSTFIKGSPVFFLGPLTVESTLALPFFFLAWSSFFHNERLRGWQFVLLFLPSPLLFFAVLNVSGAYIYIVMVFVMLWWSKFSRKSILRITGISFGSFLILGLLIWRSAKAYQYERVLALLNPEKYANGPGYLILWAKKQMMQAGWFGTHVKGVGITDANTNLVFVSFTHYYGWAMAIILVLVLLSFGVRIIMVIPKIQDTFGKLLLVGSVSLFTIQVATNLLMTLGYFPMTSMSLPFISYGFMPVLLNAILIGIALSVYRRKDLWTKRMVLDKK